MRDRLLTVVRYWAPIAIAVTGVCFLIFGVAQQSLRSGLNEPQIQLAQDTAGRLIDGLALKDIPSTKVDVAASLSPWVMVYDATGTPVAGAASLEGSSPLLPKGVFASTKESGEERVTWQPRKDVRVAAVVEYFQSEHGSGFVVSGRNMREIEGRIGDVGWQAVIVWAVTLMATFAAAYVLVPAPSAER